MTKKKSNKNKNKRRNFSSVPRELPPTAVVYTGPIISRSDREEADTYTKEVNLTSTLSSNSSGIISQYFYSNISSAPDWAALAALYNEYRVLGMRVEYFPHNRYSKSTTLTTPLITAIRRDNVVLSPGSYAGVDQFASAKKKSLEDPWSIEVKMASFEEASFLNIADVTPRFGILAYADGLSVSTIYGRYFIYWRVQFRGKL